MYTHIASFMQNMYIINPVGLYLLLALAIAIIFTVVGIALCKLDQMAGEYWNSLEEDISFDYEREDENG